MSQTVFFEKLFEFTEKLVSRCLAEGRAVVVVLRHLIRRKNIFLFNITQFTNIDRTRVRRRMFGSIRQEYSAHFSLLYLS